MSHFNSRQYNSMTYQEACEWFVEFRTDDPDEALRLRFYAWIQESPANVAAYLDVARTWSQNDSEAIARRFPVQGLIEQAADDSADVLVALGESRRAPTEQQARPASGRRSWLRRRPWPAIAASLACAFVGSAVLWWLQNAGQTYVTGLGEHHFIVLRDGSMINLNARSRVRVRYSTAERSVELLEGQALFSVTKDAARPFVVYSGSTQVKAVGTEFDVYRKPAGTVVTVIEGQVAVVGVTAPQSVGEKRNAPVPVSAPRMVSAGQQLTVRPGAAPLLVTLDASVAANWAQGRLVFSSTPLKDVVEEFNRYNERQVVIADSSLGQFEIDGVFSSTDANALIQFLRRRSDVDIAESGGQIVIRSR